MRSCAFPDGKHDRVLAVRRRCVSGGRAVRWHALRRLRCSACWSLSLDRSFENYGSHRSIRLLRCRCCSGVHGGSFAISSKLSAVDCSGKNARCGFPIAVHDLSRQYSCWSTICSQQKVTKGLHVRDENVMVLKARLTTAYGALKNRKKPRI